MPRKRPYTGPIHFEVHLIHAPRLKTTLNAKQPTLPLKNAPKLLLESVSRLLHQTSVWCEIRIRYIKDDDSRHEWKVFSYILLLNSTHFIHILNIIVHIIIILRQCSTKPTLAKVVFPSVLHLFHSQTQEILKQIDWIGKSSVLFNPLFKLRESFLNWRNQGNRKVNKQAKHHPLHEYVLTPAISKIGTRKDLIMMYLSLVHAQKS